MMIPITDRDKIKTLKKAIATLDNANSLIQSALGNTRECYEYHSALSDMMEDLEDIIKTLSR